MQSHFRPLNSCAWAALSEPMQHKPGLRIGTEEVEEEEVAAAARAAAVSRHACIGTAETGPHNGKVKG